MIIKQDAVRKISVLFGSFQLLLVRIGGELPPPLQGIGAAAERSQVRTMGIVCLVVNVISVQEAIHRVDKRILLSVLFQQLLLEKSVLYLQCVRLYRNLLTLSLSSFYFRRT